MSSYNIRPLSNKKFQAAKVQNLIKNVVDNECSKIDYNEENGKLFSERLSVLLIDKLKALEFGSYKYIVNVILGERRGSGIRGTSKCYFDNDADGCTSYTYVSNNSHQQQKSAIFCIVTVFGIYYY